MALGSVTQQLFITGVKRNYLGTVPLMGHCWASYYLLALVAPLDGHDTRQLCTNQHYLITYHYSVPEDQILTLILNTNLKKFVLIYTV